MPGISNSATFVSKASINELMVTAIIHVLDRDNKPIQCRTLVDTCSNANFITEKLAAKLRLPTRDHNSTIGALNELQTVTKQLLVATIKSRFNDYNRTLTFFTVPKIAGLVPDTQIDRAQISIPGNIKLADPRFNQPAPVDMLIGSGPALSVLSIGQHNLSTPNSPDLILQKTQLGWVIGGSVTSRSSHNKRQTFVSDLRFDLAKFWEVEEGASTQHFTMEEHACEQHFLANVTRNKSGRYVVALPFNHKIKQLGESRNQALSRLNSLQRKLDRDTELKQQYTAIIEEYLTLGHITQVQTDDTHGFYLPHHAVIKESSLTTKVRVVFDGSAQSTSGLSLNDTLMVGPTIQDDVFSLLLRFRLHHYVLTGDIEKMYRQFLVRPEDRKYQRILWRDKDDQLETFELNTVTFGLSSAPYLAIRCLQQLADDEGHQFPTAAVVLKRDMYVDDLLTGADTLEEAILIRDEISHLLSLGGLNIRQWASNKPELLENLPQGSINLQLQLDDTATVKTLGVSWNSIEDSIVYAVTPSKNTKITKRSIMSDISRIFDPLGLLGPVVITAKIIMQRLWQLKLDWDESLPTSIHTEWTSFIEQIELLNNLSFARSMILLDARNVEIHGFCDASERAYGACLYIRSTNAEGRIHCQLLCAKSRVAPLKTITIARLELCGAALLANLYSTVRQAINCHTNKAIFWSDSTIVLNWLSKTPNTLKTFVANRVADIQTKTDAASWRHIRSIDNPADSLSRGQLPAEFIYNLTWKHGPAWLTLHESTWPIPAIEVLSEVPEARRVECFVTTNSGEDLLTRYSSITRLRRIIAYCLRIKRNSSFKGELRAEEINQANERIIKLVQLSTFSREMDDLIKGRQLHSKSKILALHPFIDKAGILRVGGRLRNSNLPFARRHPILLPKNHHITTLIIRQTHLENHHAGTQATLYTVRQTYWPVDGRNLTRKIIRQCVRCFRFRPPNNEYIMGNLPAVRVTEARPFTNTGIDYCGPFYIKEKRYRNRNRIKVYVSVFICLATKAIHLEVVSDMTTDAFITALRRFIARRGKCRTIYSDNGSNFIGANRELKEVYDLQQNKIHQASTSRFLAVNGISWHFIPPLSPHFGGIWEAAVKSFKHHAKRVVGDELFTFEDFNTFVIEVEAILNSRPLTPLSSDPNDLIALTPGHFLIGDSLTSLPEIDFSTTPSNRLSHWQHIQKVKQDFWARWHKEYINELNIRQKWTKGQHEMKEGTIVVLKEDHLPPLRWLLGRIEKTHPGNDGVIRTVTVRTASGSYDRNVKKLAPLPIELL